MQEEARSILKSPVKSIVHLGTYNCRRMAAYPTWVSEHSFANAIDVATFVLKNGRTVEVERDWVRAEKPAATAAAQFLRRLTRRLYDEKVFSVVLTPSFDATTRTTCTSTARRTPSTGPERASPSGLPSPRPSPASGRGRR